MTFVPCNRLDVLEEYRVTFENIQEGDTVYLEHPDGSVVQGDVKNFKISEDCTIYIRSTGEAWEAATP